MLQVISAPTVEVHEVNDRAAFMSLKEEWNLLARSTCPYPFVLHEFIQNMIDSFFPSARLRILTGYNGSGKLVAALPLIEGRGSLWKIPLKELTSITNAQSPRFDLIAEDVEDAAAKFFAHLANDQNWDMLRLVDIPEGGNAWRIKEAAEAARFPVGSWRSDRAPYIPLPSSYEELIKTLGPSLQRNLTRRRRQLANLGELKLEIVTDQHDRIDPCLQDIFTVEERGWKGRRGIAIAHDERTVDFYTKLAFAAANEGYLKLYLLRLNDKHIASFYSFSYGGIFYALKITFDEDYGKYSPGLVLMGETLKDCIAHGLTKFDFLGSNLAWKQQWTKKTLEHRWLYIFRNNNIGRLLHTAKFRLMPIARLIADKVTGKSETPP